MTGILGTHFCPTAIRLDRADVRFVYLIYFLELPDSQCFLAHDGLLVDFAVGARLDFAATVVLQVDIEQILVMRSDL